jgi:hypothetical protein
MACMGESASGRNGDGAKGDRAIRRRGESGKGGYAGVERNAYSVAPSALVFFF